ncbi:MAG TPA: alpha-1,4-glucan--maltose-1-phosphate maltosyltransferase [Rhodanobacteraceae bacterium]|nr:alpha-1,4-glucan--maltose-1-phosphate maltosyltransferase [Rhodanobacteraceae bacterium]
MSLLRIYRPRLDGSATVGTWRPLLARCQAAGFSHVLLPTPWPAPDAPGAAAPADAAVPPAPQALLDGCREHGLVPLFDLRMDWCAADDARVAAHRDWFRFDPRGAVEPPDPRRRDDQAQGADAWWRWNDASVSDAIAEWWRTHLDACIAAGAGGFHVRSPQRLPVARLQALMRGARRQRTLVFIADTPGLRPRELRALAPLAFDAVLSSAPWWDGRAPWYAEEQARLRALAPVLVPLQAAGDTAQPPADTACRRHQRALDFAVATGDGVLMDEEFARDFATALGVAAGAGALPLEARIVAAHHCLAQRPAQALRQLSAPHEAVGAWLREGAGEAPAEDTRLVLINADLDHARAPVRRTLRAALGEHTRLAPLLPGDGDAPDGELVEAGGVRAWVAQPAPRARHGGNAVETATAAPRIAIEAVSPSVDGGLFAAKRCVGSELAVEADVFIDGHESLGVELLWRACDEKTWQRCRMRGLGNDRWRGEAPLPRLGRHEFMIEAWHNRFAGAREDLRKRELAGVAEATDIADTIALVEQIAAQAAPPHQGLVEALLDELRAADRPTQVDLLLAERSADLVAAADPRPQRARSRPYAVDVDPQRAGFAAWYELFPRSQSGDPARHGRFEDVIGRLDAIAAMGFDVLYLPPIHPIGRSQRKGRNNALQAAADDPGSVYAIGADDGGHTAVHAELGTLEDFRRLRQAAARRGMEIALDLAVQCSPDHPWLREHPGWFDWRSDGTVRHAENPPKRYEDIVNVDFYAEEALPDLWLALREVVRFWIGEGITTFRVDNPHTKPMPFWSWLIGSIRGEDPEVIFLAEAFTRPKLLRRLAKLGFNQSYTYFTWRNSKPELIEYLRELGEGPEAEYLRPHFFANTPDINPWYLQTSGRAGFVVRAALAATLSGLWGIYSGFELCEADALPGREEYADSEKYQLKPRDWDAPGNVIGEIAQLNRIRRLNPALHSHLGTQFHHAGNDQILWFERATPARDNVLLVAVNLDPHHAQEADVELPLWNFGLPDEASLQAEDLLNDRAFAWRGKWQHLRLDPAQSPFAIWRVRAEGAP